MSTQDSSVAGRPKAASAPGRTRKRLQFLPEGTGALVRRRLLDLAGIFLVIVGLALLLACLTFSVADPSLNRATEAPPGNLLGAPGAVIADVLFQGFGMAAFFPPFVFICWGWRVLRHHEVPHRWSRLAASLAALIGLAVWACQDHAGTSPRAAAVSSECSIGGSNGTSRTSQTERRVGSGCVTRSS